jgi:hypothetical protein
MDRINRQGGKFKAIKGWKHSHVVYGVADRD